MFAISMTVKTILTKCLVYCHVEALKLNLNITISCRFHFKKLHHKSLGILKKFEA